MVAELQLPQGDDWDLNLYEVEDPATVPEGSMLSGRQLSEEQRSLLHAAVDDMEQGCNLLMDNLGIEGKRRPFKVMELCCEADSGISTEVEAMGGIGIRCGLHNGCDLQKEAGVQKVLQLLEKEKPDLLWVSFPCGPTSVIQELNMLTEEGRERIRKKVLKSKKLVGNGIRVMERQVQLGGEVFQEWPANNRAWGFTSIRTFWDRIYQKQTVFEARIDGCAYGLKAPDGLKRNAKGLQAPEGFMKKPWRIRATSSLVWNLQKTCPGDHEHIPCEGGQRTRMSAFYPDAMCRKVAHLVKCVHENRLRQETLAHYSCPGYAMAATPVEGNPDSLKDCTNEELHRWANNLLKLHKKLGHPSRQAFTRMLRDRGATIRMITIASNLHCRDCEESRMANPQHRGFTLETAEHLWEVVQLDNFEFSYGMETYHFQLLVDEASGYSVLNYLFKHPIQESRSPSTAEILQGILKSWIQYFGYPQKFKLDKEGGHRGRDLEQWGDTHGVEFEFVPAEAHGQIGKVESAIGKLKSKLQAHLRGEEDDPVAAAWSMVAAHNSMARRGGYSPIQWVFGKDFTDADRLHDGPDLPFWSSLNTDEKFQKIAGMRERAKTKYKELMDLEKLSKAMNIKPMAARAYHPGDLVYYKRHQAPAEGRSHQKLDVPRRQISRWFGPARILGLETKVTYEGQVRRPHRMAWLISQGRLKRVHTDQLRHASEREKLTNEEFHDILATPWTFTDVTSVLDKGTYDDLVELPHLQRGRPHDIKPRRSPSRGRGGQKRANSASRPRSAPPTKAKTEEMVMNDRPPSEPYEPSIAEEFMPDDQDLPPVPSDDDLEGPEEVDLDRLLDDPNYMPRMEPGPPTGPLFEHEPFQRARARHEREDPC